MEGCYYIGIEGLHLNMAINLNSEIVEYFSGDAVFHRRTCTKTIFTNILDVLFAYVFERHSRIENQLRR